jgi:hypothetical protein
MSAPAGCRRCGSYGWWSGAPLDCRRARLAARGAPLAVRVAVEGNQDGAHLVALAHARGATSPMTGLGSLSRGASCQAPHPRRLPRASGSRRQPTRAPFRRPRARHDQPVPIRLCAQAHRAPGYGRPCALGSPAARAGPERPVGSCEGRGRTEPVSELSCRHDGPIGRRRSPRRIGLPCSRKHECGS